MLTCKIVAYLFSLAVGYWVLTLAAKEKGTLQKIGKALGWVIIVVSLCGPLCLAWCGMKCGPKGGHCGSGYGCKMDGDGKWGKHCGYDKKGKKDEKETAE